MSYVWIKLVTACGCSKEWLSPENWTRSKYVVSLPTPVKISGGEPDLANTFPRTRTFKLYNEYWDNVRKIRVVVYEESLGE
jgi:hypothetical protein